MDAEHHMYLIAMLQEVFGSKLCTHGAVESITLDYLWEKKHQVSSSETQFTNRIIDIFELLMCVRVRVRERVSVVDGSCNLCAQLIPATCDSPGQELVMNIIPLTLFPPSNIPYLSSFCAFSF